jgi:hypothetical protein
MALGSVAPDDLERAQKELGSDGLPRLEGLELAAATADALLALGQAPAAEKLRERIRTACAAMVATLAKWPDRQRVFRASFPAQH